MRTSRLKIFEAAQIVLASDKASDVRLQVTQWARHAALLSAIRQQVFIDEQKVPDELEWDDLDNSAIHILAYLGSDPNRPTQAIGCARIVESRTTNTACAHIGRMAVLAHWRTQGIGFRILQRCISECQGRNIPLIELNAQSSAIGFYRKAGFAICSDEFLDANILHRQMRLQV